MYINIVLVRHTKGCGWDENEDKDEDRDWIGWERGWMHGNEDGCMGMRMGVEGGKRMRLLFILLLLPL